MPLTTRWINTIYTIATGSRRLRNLYTPIGASLFALFACGFVALGRYADRLLGMDSFLPGWLRIAIATPMFALALFLISWSVGHFLKARGTPVPINPPPKLVTNGPYAHTRNPMLTGVFALLFGIGFLLGSICLTFLFTPTFILLNYWELKKIEEPELVRRLGQAYVDYRAATPMFLPRVGARHHPR